MPYKTAAMSRDPVQIIHCGLDHRVCQQTSFLTNSSGARVAVRTNRWTELATGMNARQPDGSWRSADDAILLTSDGAAATNTQHHVWFNANLNTAGAIRLETADGKRFRSTIRGSSYYDPVTGKAVWLAEVQDSIGQLAGRNQVRYTNAFDGVEADVQYVNSKLGLQQNVVIRSRLPSAEELGLSAEARLQVVTEFFESPAPRVTAVARPAAPGLAAETRPGECLEFGRMRMTPGKAFSLGASRKGRGALNVSNRWCVLSSGRTFLVEELPAKSAGARISGLKRTRSASVAPRRQGKGASLLTALERIVPAPGLTGRPGRMTLASLDPGRQPGFVLDYEINGYASELTLASDTTYYLSDDLWVQTLNLEGTVVKFALGAQLCVEQLNCLTGPYRPAFFSSLNDESIGEYIPALWGTPEECYGGAGLSFQGGYLPGTNSVHDCRFRYMNTAILFGPGRLDNTVSNCQFLHCGTAASADWEGLEPLGNPRVALRNCLFSQCDSAWSGPALFTGEQLTLDQVAGSSSDQVTATVINDSPDNLTVWITDADADIEWSDDGEDVTYVLNSGQMYVDGAFILHTDSADFTFPAQAGKRYALWWYGQYYCVPQPDDGEQLLERAGPRPTRHHARGGGRFHRPKRLLPASTFGQPDQLHPRQRGPFWRLVRRLQRLLQHRRLRNCAVRF